MVCIMKPLIRFGVLAGLAGGAALAIAGPERVAAVFHQTKSSVHAAIDRNIDDPVALRAQLRKLAEQYPARIGDVRADLAELNEQIRQLEREKTVAARVVELARADLDELQDMLARADEARGTGRAVRIAFDGRTFDVDSAYRRATQVAQTRDAYAARVSETERDLGYLQQQSERLGEILATLEAEQAEFQTQLFNLDRQVDAVARNERLIDIMEKRQHTIDAHSKYEVQSFDQMKGRLADIRAKQEAQLESLAGALGRVSYEDRAKISLDEAASARREFERSAGKSVFEEGRDKGASDVIEITPDASKQRSEGPVASARPVIIE